MHQSMQYRGFSPSDDIVVWFWKLMHSLKEEEKALLLKFATGSPRAPAGGFSTFQVAINNIEFPNPNFLASLNREAHVMTLSV